MFFSKIKIKFKGDNWLLYAEKIIRQQDKRQGDHLGNWQEMIVAQTWVMTVELREGVTYKSNMDVELTRPVDGLDIGRGDKEKEQTCSDMVASFGAEKRQRFMKRDVYGSIIYDS